MPGESPGRPATPHADLPATPLRPAAAAAPTPLHLLAFPGPLSGFLPSTTYLLTSASTGKVPFLQECCEGAHLLLVMRQPLIPVGQPVYPILHEGPIALQPIAQGH